jgi:DNA-binding response OmpR family regulator
MFGDQPIKESRIVIVGEGHLATRLAGMFTGAGYQSVSVASHSGYIPSNESADLLIVCPGPESSDRPTVPSLDGDDGLDIPVVVVSGQSGSAARVRALAAGASACLTQPVDPFELLVEVRRTLENRLRGIARGRDSRLAGA